MASTLRCFSLRFRRAAHKEAAKDDASSSASSSEAFPSHLERKKGDDSILELRQKMHLTGEAKPGSHSACFGLTQDGSKHEPIYPDPEEVARAQEPKEEGVTYGGQ
jgi:hypothetical protein